MMYYIWCIIYDVLYIVHVIIVDTGGYKAQLQQEEISQRNLLEQALITPLFKKQEKNW